MAMNRTLGRSASEPSCARASPEVAANTVAASRRITAGFIFTSQESTRTARRTRGLHLYGLEYSRCVRPCLDDVRLGLPRGGVELDERFVHQGHVTRADSQVPFVASVLNTCTGLQRARKRVGGGAPSAF